jgi:hypothetical protein
MLARAVIIDLDSTCPAIGSPNLTCARKSLHRAYEALRKAVYLGKHVAEEPMIYLVLLSFI